MEGFFELLTTLLRSVARIDVSAGSVTSDLEFRETVERAHAAVGQWAGVAEGERNDCAIGPIVSALLGALYIKKSRLAVTILDALQQLLRISGIRYNENIILYQSQTCRKALQCGDAIFCALGDFLASTTNSVAQLKVLEILHELVCDDDFPSFTGRCVTRCVQICCQATLQASNEGLRTASRDLLLLCFLRVTRAFIEAAPPEGRSSTFASSTKLENYIYDVELDTNHTYIEIEGFVAPFVGDNQADVLEDTAAVIMDTTTSTIIPPVPATATAFSSTFNSAPEGHPALQASVTTSLFHLSDNPRSSLDSTIMTSALSVLQERGRFPSPMRDFLFLIRHACQIATRIPSGSVSTSEENPEVRLRQLALEMLEALFAAIPVANCHVEHHCAMWLSLVLAATKYDLLRCIARNLSSIAPPCFYLISVRILVLLMRKCHYHLGRELHALLAVMLFPLAQSKFSSFSQKCAVLGMVRELFSTPHLCVSFFINYDCNPAFDPGAKYGGMLELMVDFVMAMTFTDFIEPEWLSFDQQQLLRGESASTMHNLVQSMLRWIAEDPLEYMHQQMREVASRVLGRFGNTVQVMNQWHGVYMESWDSDVSEEETVRSEVMSTDCNTPLSNDDAAPSQHSWGKTSAVGYHWKHIHHLLQNKRIAQEALQHINKGQWREGMTLLQQHRYIPHMETNEAGCWTALAQFLKVYSGVERVALCKIFERVLKDPDCDRIVKEYLSLFRYKDVPIDIALRDTTCEFMSWDRPTFEAQVWNVIQERFGAEYALQNPHYITSKDASALAGVLLFLHTSLHNINAKDSRMTVEEFVRNGNQCLELPLPENEMRAIYHRVAGRKWELDRLGRTPYQVELETNANSFYEKISQQQHRFFSSTRGDVVSEVLASSHSCHDLMISLQRHADIVNSPDDISLLDVEIQPYTTHQDGYKFRESYHQRYAHEAAQHLLRLESEHRLQRLDRCDVQPYIVPHYAQHVRPMLLMLYPQIAATLYMCFRVLEEHPIFRLILETYQMLYDIAAAFVVNLGGMRVAVERKIQRCLADGGAQQLFPPTRATFTLPLLNLV